jgi:methylase of polypeptide subunit release factors
MPSGRRTEFGGLSISWQDGVLQPRPWTLMQSRWAGRVASDHAAPILELFAGVGHIGLVAACLSGRPLVQVEIDPVACQLARENARRAGISDRVEIRCAPVELALSPAERYSVVIADPPYLPSAQVDHFPRDPIIAVDGGADGLDLARESLRHLERVSIESGAILMQLGGPDQVARLAVGLGRHLWVTEVRTAGPDRAVALVSRARSVASGRENAHPGVQFDCQNAIG